MPTSAPSSAPARATAPTLATQLHWTAQCVLAVEKGRSLSDALPQVPAALRPGVQALTFTVLRQLGAARALGRRLAQRPPAPPAAALLHSALALLLDDAQGLRYAPHTLVDQAVEAAKASRGTQAQAGFLNACLRRCLREREALCAGLDHDPVARWNHPAWWIERLQRDWPAQWQAVLRSANDHPPMSLRVNARRATAQHYVEQLAAAGRRAWAVPDPALLPTADLQRAAADFHRNVELIDGLLARHGAMLLPGGAHPWMDPGREMVLWPHDAHEIYDLYNTIFDCRGHGWANLQSAHLNLPFAGDDEFARLHTAIRLLLPRFARAPSRRSMEVVAAGFMAGAISDRYISVVRRAMSRDANARFQTMRELGDALAEGAPHQARARRQPPAGRTPRAVPTRARPRPPCG